MTHEPATAPPPRGAGARDGAAAYRSVAGARAGTTLPEAAETMSAHTDPPAAGREGVVAVRPDRQVLSRQKLPYFVGISGATAGAAGLSMNLVVIPPGGRAEPHHHRGYETALYVLQGRVETLYGPGLRKSIVSEAGEFLFIDRDVPHQAINLSDTEPAMGIVARNDPNEQESVRPYDPAAE